MRITVLTKLKCCHLKLELLEGEQSKIKDDIHQSNSSGNKVLDFDGCVTKGSRHNGNASKNFSTVRSEDYSPSLFEARNEYWTKKINNFCFFSFNIIYTSFYRLM
ncbi:unnamed protein product [Rhizophagus irregularis]|nr:unnamed protein product [Rhizophagus irregularis]